MKRQCWTQQKSSFVSDTKFKVTDSITIYNFSTTSEHFFVFLKGKSQVVGQETEKETQPSQSKKPKSDYVPLATLNRTNNNEITTDAASTKLFEEFDTFLSEPTVDWELDFSPCKFWKTNGHRFPRLATIARDVFGVPAFQLTLKGYLILLYAFFLEKR